MYFDNKAKEWDKDPQKNARAEVFAKEINDFIKPNKKLDALEFGCGTGLLSFKLKDCFKTIRLMDHSEGMISVLKEKIDKAGIKNFIPLKMDLFERKTKLPKTDVIYTLMTLHHMPDIDRTLKEFHSLLASNGFLCIADLVKEDGSFHGHRNDFEGHNGFDKKELGAVLLKNGFQPVYDKECFVIDKIMEGEIKKFPLFLMICRKSSGTLI